MSDSESDKRQKRQHLKPGGRIGRRRETDAFASVQHGNKRRQTDVFSSVQHRLRQKANGEAPISSDSDEVSSESVSHNPSRQSEPATARSFAQDSSRKMLSLEPNVVENSFVGLNDSKQALNFQPAKVVEDVNSNDGAESPLDRSEPDIGIDRDNDGEQTQRHEAESDHEEEEKEHVAPLPQKIIAEKPTKKRNLNQKFERLNSIDQVFERMGTNKATVIEVSDSNIQNSIATESERNMSSPRTEIEPLFQGPINTSDNDENPKIKRLNSIDAAFLNMKPGQGNVIELSDPGVRIMSSVEENVHEEDEGDNEKIEQERSEDNEIQFEAKEEPHGKEKPQSKEESQEDQRESTSDIDEESLLGIGLPRKTSKFESFEAECPKCNESTMTKVSISFSSAAYILCAILFFLCLWCFCWVPFCLGKKRYKFLRDCEHRCPKCFTLLAHQRRG